MSSADQNLTKRLAEMKSFLEHRLKQQEEEVASLRSFLEVIDSILAERSFRRVEVPASVKGENSRPLIPKAPSNSLAIMTVDGIRIASMTVDDGNLHLFPEPGLNLDADSPPLRAFLLGKVLDPMQAKDKEAAGAGELAPDKILSYDLEEEEGRLRAIHVQNYGDDRRLLELKNAIRWTLRRMYERSATKKPTQP